MRPSTRTIKRWAVIKGPTHPSNPVTEHDEDTFQSFRINPRQLVSKCVFNSLSLSSQMRWSLPLGNPPLRRNPVRERSSSLSIDLGFFLERVPAVSNVNVYLYEGARHHHVPMMLHALALGADKNFLNEHDHGRTPLIQTTINASLSKDHRHERILFVLSLEICRGCRVPADQQCQSESSGSRWSNTAALRDTISEERTRVRVHSDLSLVVIDCCSPLDRLSFCSNVVLIRCWKTSTASIVVHWRWIRPIPMWSPGIGWSLCTNRWKPKMPMPRRPTRPFSMILCTWRRSPGHRRFPNRMILPVIDWCSSLFVYSFILHLQYQIEKRENLASIGIPNSLLLFSPLHVHVRVFYLQDRQRREKTEWIKVVHRSHPFCFYGNTSSFSVVRVALIPLLSLTLPLVLVMETCVCVFHSHSWRQETHGSVAVVVLLFDMTSLVLFNSEKPEAHEVVKPGVDWGTAKTRSRSSDERSSSHPAGTYLYR